MVSGLALALGLASCGGPPRMARENRRLVESLATAISARNPDWLARNVAEIEAKRSAGALSDTEDKALGSIIATAQAGRWDEAQAAVLALRDAQSANAEDVREVTDAPIRLPGRAGPH
jgi:hypothetical protein